MVDQLNLESVPVLQAVAWNVIIPAIISAMGMFMKDGGQGQQQMTPEMREMLKTQLARMRGQEPLYQDVMGMARGLLPTRYRTGQGMGANTWDGLRPGEDLRQPGPNAQPTGRFAIPRNSIDDIVRDGRRPRTPQV